MALVRPDEALADEALVRPDEALFVRLDKALVRPGLGSPRPPGRGSGPGGRGVEFVTQWYAEY